MVLRAHPISEKRRSIFGRDRRRIRHRLFARVIKMKRPRTWDLYLGHRRRQTMTKVYRTFAGWTNKVETELNVEENPSPLSRPIAYEFLQLS